ncbi:acyltransferase [Methylosinus sp. H3A]|uniref:acyltransferase family protein n=2 Tax=Methylosinus sp. H3A TaxID=2785786 RepID=UPI0018C209F9|nr:acyltransferase [Methylosinus sp. H3A]MBG0807851.1 acyltransferase [Methylosinus sp. H3A]MBG0812574.1 acyltransferase [Methylosinus sp. H3A]
MFDKALGVTSGVAEGKEKFHALDALRGVAAVSIVTMHFKDFFQPYFAAHGYLAVDLFFVISGAVIESAYAGPFVRGLSAFKFVKIRLIRFYPLYIVAILLAASGAVASYFGNNKSGFHDLQSVATSAVLSLAFIPSPNAATSGSLFPLNAAIWSLLFELVVNFGYALLWERLQRMEILFAVILASGAILALASLYFGSVDYGPHGSTADFIVGFARATFGFFCGVAIFRLNRDTHAASTDLPSSANQFGFLAVTGFVALILFLESPVSLIGAIDAIMVLFAFPAIVWASMRVDLRGPWRKLSLVLGEASYAVYVLHLPVLGLAAAISVRFGNIIVAKAPYSGCVVIVVLIAACWLLDKIYDAPVRRWLRDSGANSASGA